MNEKKIEEIVSKFVDLINQGKTHEQAYDILVLQGYRKSVVDLCVIDAVNFSTNLIGQITTMAKRGLSPEEVVQALQANGYPESVIRSHIEPFLKPKEQ